jgi:putative nucleotidyltransferase with HDIG domain
LFSTQKSSARRQSIREHRPDTSVIWFNQLKCNGTFPSLGIAAVFWLLATAILMMREDVLPYRPMQFVQHDIPSRVDFTFADPGVQQEKQEETRLHYPKVYRSAFDKTAGDKTTGDIWQPLQAALLSLPDRVRGLTFDELPADLKADLDPSALTLLQRYPGKSAKAEYEQAVKSYVAKLRARNWVIISADRKAAETGDRIILLPGEQRVDVKSTYTAPADADLRAQIHALVRDDFRLSLQPKIEAMTVAAVQPTFVYDADQSVLAANNAADRLPESEWTIQYYKNEPIVHKGIIEMHDWKVLQTENKAFIASLDGEAGWKSKSGVALMALLMTIAMSCYTAAFQPKVVSRHGKAVAIGVLMLAMLLLAQLAGLGTGPIYLFSVTPTLLVGMILSIAYDQRFAVGLGSIHALLVTVGLDQRIGFFLTLWVGLIFSCFMLRELRSRSRLIEIGGVAAIAMMMATMAWGLISLDSWSYILSNVEYVGAAGFATGFVVLGTLPFIEKAFRITTGMTLLELADFSHPLLRRLALEAPGTYNHSLQVATLAEAAAEAVGANSLLCRVAAYYHDVGKINKPDYFVENQQQGQQSRHLTLTPNVSFLIIKGHVMDGIEMAREYALPTSIFPFIQQHHGTTLVEYFYEAARLQQEKTGATEISETEFRYPGPKPHSREVGILMMADCAESAMRAMQKPTPAGIEDLVHKLTRKRLEDGQFDDCDLTLRDVHRIEQSLIKTLLSIHHVRVAYPSTVALTGAAPVKALPEQAAEATA